MGKYQLDYKGQAQVRKFHEKQVGKQGLTQAERIAQLKKQYQDKKAHAKSQA